MPHTILKPKTHLTYEETKQRYRTCENTVEKQRWNLIRLMSKPEKPLIVTMAAEASGFKQRWARQLVHRYNKEGPAGLSDRRANNPGKEPILNNKQKNRLKSIILNESPTDGGLWTSVKIANWIEQKTGERPSDRTGLNYLKNLGFSLQQPRPKHPRSATEEDLKKFKKN